MHCGGDFSTPPDYLHLFNDNLWAEIEPAKNTCKVDYANKVTSNRKKTEERPKKKAEKKEEEEERSIENNRIMIRNKRFSFTSFLIPLCITGETKDYKLLYCINAIKNSIKFLSSTLRKEGFAQLYMVGMKSEVDWEKIKADGISFSDVVTDFLIKSGAVCLVAANRKETFKKVNDRDAPFVVIFTAADIHLPCRENLCVGTGWVVFRRTEKSRDLLFDREVYHSGRRAIHAGILANGCGTIMTVGFKRMNGIHTFVFDNKHGDFVLLQDYCFIRQSGNLMVLNEGLYYRFTKNIQKWLMKKKVKKQEYHSRYTGGWLTDGYRVLRSGGLLLSPEDNESNEGRIKLLYKALPLAFLAEKAGGKATDGKFPITKLHRLSTRITFTSLVLGSLNNVDAFMEVLKRAPKTEGIISACEKYSSTASEQDSDETSTDLE